MDAALRLDQTEVDSTLSNRDVLKRLRYPRQPYAFSGFDWGDASENKVRDKLEIVGAPLWVGSMPPGALPNNSSDDEGWQSTYGASLDATMALMEGRDLFLGIRSSTNKFNFPYSDSLFLAKNSNLYEKPNDQQQIQFIASKDSINEAREEAQAGDVQDMRSLCMRQPMHVAGWGRTVGIRPTDPNPANPRENDDEHKLDRSTWKTGPLDIRWDEDRGVWRAWNDLVADQEGKNLGTLVFSTNPDLACGFPRLRGKLEDVWWVRRTDPTAPTNPNDDGTKTGEITTHMAHRLYDNLRTGAGPLSDVFLSKVGTAVSCGTETTRVGGRPADIVTTDQAVGTNPGLEEKTGTFFYWNDLLRGPIKFTDVPFNDDEIPAELKWDGQTWRPYYKDRFGGDPDDGTALCAIPGYANHLITLTFGGNDRNIVVDGVFGLQDLICKWNEEYTECILRHIRWVASNAGEAVNALNYQIPPYIKLVASAISSSVLASIGGAFANYNANVTVALNQIIQQIQACFTALEIVCPVEFNLTPPAVPPAPVELPEFSVVGFAPPDCLIESYASYETRRGEDIRVLIETPCLGAANIYVGSCGAPGTGSTGVTPVPGLTFGGTDADGDNLIGGKSFGNPGEEGQAPSNPNSGTGSTASFG